MTDYVCVDLQDKVAVVTGAGRGIGRAASLELAHRGARLALCARNKTALDGVVEEIVAAGGAAIALPADVALSETAPVLFKAALNAFGRVDILVNCAGMNQDRMLHKMSDEEWDAVLAVNLGGTFYMTREAARLMREQASGRIINIGSSAWLGNAGQANYAAAKAAVVALTKTAARELAAKNVTCNVVCPGFIDTDMTRGMPQAAKADMVAKIPARRPGSPEEVAHTIAFLASDAAAYITGEVINVGGGLVL